MESTSFAFFFFFFHCFSLFVVLPPPASSSCGPSDLRLISLAFRQVDGFKLPPRDAGECSLVLPSCNLTGTVSWMYLRNVSALRVLDLSGNSLHGSVPGGFWSSPALLDVNLSSNRLGGALRLEPTGPSSPPPLRSLDLSGNRFTSAAGLESLPRLEVLDLSRNSLALVPPGLNKLRRLRRLDVSMNSMRGVFPGGLPPLHAGLAYLNVSYNNFTGIVKPDVVKKFGMSAFVKAGTLRFPSSAHVARSSSPTPLPSQKKKDKQRRWKREIKFGIIVGVASVLVVFVVILFVVMKKKRKWRKDDKKWAEKEVATAAVSPQEAKWVVGAKMSAPVVLFEKPLMELSFADLAKATSGFGRESQMAEGGRSGPAYRAVFPDDIHVVVRVVEAAREAEERAAAAYFRDLARLRHPNLLPLLGYCIPGKEKLALYEYMEKGDLHRWLHELPAGKPDVEDWSGDTWEPHSGEERHEDTVAGRSAEVVDWPTRHRIALGIARGLAFLHQGWVGSTRGVAHGHLVPSNVLLGDDLEPRVADFGSAATGGTAEGDVYDFGVVVMELVTGREGWSEEAVGWARGMVRSGRVAETVDPRLKLASAEEEKEVVECFRVGYLCTAPAAEKRPTMQQVVGLLKDLHSTSRSTAGGRAATTFAA